MGLGIRLRRATLFTWVISSCYQGASSDAGDGGGDAGQDGASEADDDDGADDDGGDEGPADELPGANTRLFRLTHAQWENSVRDLFGEAEPLGLSAEFRVDAKAGPYEFDNSATGLEVDGPLWAQYQRAAVEVAAFVAADPARLERILPADTGDEAARAREFVRTFGRRAFRRPLSEAEIDRHVALFDEGQDLYDDATGFEAGVRAVIEVMLQSPWFLYRVETSQEADGDVIPLAGFEVASRMSYFLWDSMPDDELLDAAEADELADSDQLETQARRMLEDPRAVAVVQRFHEVVFDLDRYERIDPNPSAYPQAPADLAALAREEFHRFVGHVALGEAGGGLAQLLTSNETFANDELAAIYGLDVEGADFQLVELDSATRRGLLTQVGFLASHATPVDPDPIHRGVFITKRLACQTLTPPDNIPSVPSPAEGETNRDVVEALTEAPGSACAGCHASIINPFGYPFEHYDSVGAYRELDRGFEIDASSEVQLDGAAIPVNGALELAEALAGSAGVHGCYARYWVSYAAGRWATEEEQPLVARLGASSLDDELSIVELVVQVVKSRPFRTRSTQELDP